MRSQLNDFHKVSWTRKQRREREKSVKLHAAAIIMPPLSGYLSLKHQNAASCEMNT